jgi:hypothetical protein
MARVIRDVTAPGVPPQRTKTKVCEAQKHSFAKKLREKFCLDVLEDETQDDPKTAVNGQTAQGTGGKTETDGARTESGLTSKSLSGSTGWDRTGSMPKFTSVVDRARKLEFGRYDFSFFGYFGLPHPASSRTLCNC